MKKISIILIILGVAVAGGIVWLAGPKAALAPAAPTVAIATDRRSTQDQPASLPAAKPETQAVSAGADGPAKISAAMTATATPQVDTTANSIRNHVNALLTAKNGTEKQALLDQLGKAGHLDLVMAELKRLGAENPHDAAIPTTLGEVQIRKLRNIMEAGGDMNEVGILGMQADQSFNVALKIDPNNYEAQFVKAVVMHYWPPDPARDSEIVQRLSGLIDRQESMAAQPEFVLIYVALGEQFQKMNQSDKAMATWQLGLQKFPADPALQKKISGQ